MEESVLIDIIEDNAKQKSEESLYQYGKSISGFINSILDDASN